MNASLKLVVLLLKITWMYVPSGKSAVIEYNPALHVATSRVLKEDPTAFAERFYASFDLRRNVQTLYAISFIFTSMFPCRLYKEIAR